MAEANTEDLLKGEGPEKTKEIFILTLFFINVECSVFGHKTMWSLSFLSEVLFKMHEYMQNQEGKREWLTFFFFCLV